MENIEINRIIYLEVSTYENLRNKGERLICLINSILEKFLLPMDIPLDVYITKMNTRSKNFVVNEKNLAKIYKMLKSGEVQHFVLGEYYGEYDSLREEYINYQKKSGEEKFIPFAMSFVCDYFEEMERFLDISKNPKIANVFSFYINEKMLNNIVDGNLQEKFIELFKTVFIQLNGVSGFLSYESMVGGVSATPYEHAIGLREINAFQDFDKYLRGYYWGNIISERHIEQLGSIDKILKDSPCSKVERIELTNREALYLQLTEDINNYSDDELRRLRSFLQPVLPKGLKMVWHDPYKTQKDFYKHGCRLLEEDHCIITDDKTMYLEYLKNRDGR